MATFHHAAAGRPHLVRTILYVSSDEAARQSAAILLRQARIHVLEAASGAAALGLVRQGGIHAGLIDQQLPDMTGLQVAPALRTRAVPWILMSVAMDYNLAAAGGRAGAQAVLRLPCDVARELLPLLEGLFVAEATLWPPLPIAPRLRENASAVDHLAFLMLKACDAKGDLRGIRPWSAFVGMSYTRLRAACYAVRITPDPACRFMRLLRALWRTDGRVRRLETELKFGERSTFDDLLAGGGLSAAIDERVSLEDYIARQRYIDADHPVLPTLATYAGSLTHI